MQRMNGPNHQMDKLLRNGIIIEIKIYSRSGLIYNTKNILFSKINSLYAQHDIDTDWVITYLQYKNTGLFFPLFW